MSDVSVRAWLAPRDLAYVARRARALTNRYGFTPGRARRRIDACVSVLGAQGCAPSFMVPGRVVEAHAGYLRSLVDQGVELALHGFDHVDFKTLTPEAIVRQFEHSADAFTRAGIPFHGFRCPYLSATEEVFRHVPADLVAYSSNVAIRWPEAEVGSSGNAVLRQLETFYAPLDADTTIAVPTVRTGGLIELPCALPDDIQLFDGLDAGEEGLEEAWGRVLDAVHAREELHVLLFHPELADRCRRALEALVERARSLRPYVWVAPLHAVATWWRERAECTVTRVVREDGELAFTLAGSERATLVAGTASGRRLVLAAQPLPVIGILPTVDAQTRAALSNLGYVLEEIEPHACAVVLEGGIAIDRELLRRLSQHPLVRVARWPDGAGAALCISGDLDALSLVDYARRLSTR